jgi:hypothetical protein
MEETLSTNQRLSLTLVGTLKERCLEEHNVYPFEENEFRLNKQPESLKAFAGLFLKENGGRSERIVWVREDGDAFIGLESVVRELLPQAYRQRRLEQTLKRGSRSRNLYIHSSTLEEAISCLDFLSALQDSHYEWMELGYFGPDENEPPPVCPLPNHLLKKLLLQHERRKNRFLKMTFTPDQCRVLAACGRRTNIEFYDCRFEDAGVAFVEASAAREDTDSGPAKLTIWNILHYTLFA